MVQIYADDDIIYDSRLDTEALLGLTVTTGINKSGTAILIMPPGHPAYSRFVSYRTEVCIYKDEELKFRGRAIYPADDLYRRRTITCEGERGFLHDAVIKPYIYQSSPAEIFETVIGLYNAQVEEFKQFAVGEVTVVDANDYIRLEATSAEQAVATVDKLVERCGGYITFTTNTNGKRCINWLADMGYRSGQSIEFGQNLIDFTRTDNTTGPVTRIYPYGAIIEPDDATSEATISERVTIESVNEGIDFIQDDEAVALRGVIAQAVYWDDVGQPSNLLRKAQEWLADAKNIVTTLQLSAVDLSNMDKDIDTFQIGDLIRVRSKPHGVDDDFLLTDRTEDLLAPGSGIVTLGKELNTLVGSDVVDDMKTNNEMQRVENNIRAEYKLNVAAAVESTKQTLTSLIQQTSESIRLEVSEQYATNGELESAIQTSMTQLSDSFTFLFESLEATVNENDADAREQFLTISKYIRFENGDIILGEAGNTITLRIENDRISFLDSGAEVAYLSNKQISILDGNFIHSLQMGLFKWVPRSNNNLSLVKVGE